MRSFLDTFETHKQSFICALSICMTVLLIPYLKAVIKLRRIAAVNITTPISDHLIRFLFIHNWHSDTATFKSK